MSIEANNENGMGAPFSSVREGKRWGTANKDMPYFRGYREQIIKITDGVKVIKHHR